MSTQQWTAREPAADASRQLDFRPGMDMTWEITRSTEDTGGTLLEAANWVGGSTGGPPVHVHPTAEESYAVIEGTADVFMNGRWRTVRAGESVTVPAGMPHTIKNSSREPVRLVNTHRPAQNGYGQPRRDGPRRRDGWVVQLLGRARTASE